MIDIKLKIRNLTVSETTFCMGFWNAYGGNYMGHYMPSRINKNQYRILLKVVMKKKCLYNIKMTGIFSNIISLEEILL